MMRRLTREILLDSLVCIHGRQARKCPECELLQVTGELTAAERQLDRERHLRRTVAGEIDREAHRLVLNDDRALTVERLERWADALTEGD